MRSMALAADAGAWRNGMSATQKTGKVFRYADHLLDEAAWRTFPHAAKLLARWVDGALEPLPAGVWLTARYTWFQVETSMAIESSRRGAGS